jgi:hypothetical protein
MDSGHRFAILGIQAGSPVVYKHFIPFYRKNMGSRGNPRLFPLSASPPNL